MMPYLIPRKDRTGSATPKKSRSVLKENIAPYIIPCEGHTGSPNSKKGRGFIKGNTFDYKLVEYNIVNGLPIIEGDIILSGRLVTDIWEEGLIIKGNQFRWTDSHIPYAFDTTVTAVQQNTINQAINHWKALTHLTFSEVPTTSTINHVTFIYTGLPGGTCGLSSIGMVPNSSSQIDFAKYAGTTISCVVGNIIHEIGHIVGLWHEQSRADRNQYVTINTANIIPGQQSQFDQHITDGDDIGPYDYGSIMHYGRTAFSSNGQDTITPKNGAQIGQRNALSSGDINTVNSIYPRICPNNPKGYMSNCPRVVYRGKDDNIHELFVISNWIHGDLSDFTGAPPAAGDPFGYMSNCPRVVYRGNDNHIHELFVISNWIHGDLTAFTGAPPAAGDPMGYMSNCPRVVYRGNDNHIHELFVISNWIHGDLTAFTGAPSAAGNPFGYQADIPRVVYRGSNGHIYELSVRDNWSYLDITSQTGATPAAGDPMGYMSNCPRVVYLGTDNHIHEIYYLKNNWGHTDLTAATGAPPAAGNPFGYMSNCPRVVYRANDNHIHELFVISNWIDGDLTAFTGAPPAAGDPMGYMSNCPRVVYRGNDNQAHELFAISNWVDGNISSFT